MATLVSDFNKTADGKATDVAIMAYVNEGRAYVMEAEEGEPGIPTQIVGKTATESVRYDYSSVNVTSASWIEFLASAIGASEIEIFDSSGQAIQLGFGAATSEARKIYIFPGGNGRVPLNVPALTRISIRAVSTTASTGFLLINFYK